MTRLATAIPESIRNVTMILLVLLGLGTSSAGPAAELPTTEEVLVRFVVAVGGREAMEEVHVRHYRGVIVQDLSWKEPRHQETPFVAESSSGGQVRYAEATSWLGLPTEDDGTPRDKLRWLIHPRFALVVEQFFPDLEVKGRELREGRSVIVLESGPLPREHYALYFDEESGLLAHIGYHTDLRDWRRVDDVLVPMRWVFGRKGGHTTYLVKEVGCGPAPRDR